MLNFGFKIRPKTSNQGRTNGIGFMDRKERRSSGLWLDYQETFAQSWFRTGLKILQNQPFGGNCIATLTSSWGQHGAPDSCWLCSWVSLCTLGWERSWWWPPSDLRWPCHSLGPKSDINICKNERSILLFLFYKIFEMCLLQEKCSK